VAAAGLAAACRPIEGPQPTLENATLTARPVPFSGLAPRGFHRFGLWKKDDAFLYVPPSYRDDTPAPFLVLLHGAGGRASVWETATPARVDDKGIVVLALDSSVQTWDRFALGGFGPDVERLDMALRYAFARCNVDPAHVALGGFSDGASYALSVGVPNGDLFTALIAFSPGALFAPGSRGKPPVFISHGSADNVIPVSNSRDQIVPQLRDMQHTVTFREFSGPHTVPAAVADEAFSWFVAL
jgi:predicted esterase